MSPSGTTTTTSVETSGSSGAGDALARLRAFHARAGARGPGVAAVLALAWESADAPVAPERVRRDGARLAERARSDWQALAGDQRDDDLGCVTSVLHALAHGEVHGEAREEVPTAALAAVPAPRHPSAARGPTGAAGAGGLADHAASFARGHVLRVLNFHNTPASRRGELRAELADLGRRYRWWTAAELEAVTAGGAWPDDDRPGALPVFYEGYAASASVAGPVCDELGITGWFAVCTGFVDCPPSQQELFARSHSIGLVPEDLAAGRLAMTWDEVGDLAERHVVFPHTASHAGIEETPRDEDLRREVEVPRERLLAATGVAPTAFAWLHGSGTGMSARHDEALRAAGYPHLLSATRLTRL